MTCQELVHASFRTDPQSERPVIPTPGLDVRWTSELGRRYTTVYVTGSRAAPLSLKQHTSAAVVGCSLLPRMLFLWLALHRPGQGRDPSPCALAPSRTEEGTETEGGPSGADAAWTHGAEGRGRQCHAHQGPAPRNAHVRETSALRGQKGSPVRAHRACRRWGPRQRTQFTEIFLYGFN